MEAKKSKEEENFFLFQQKFKNTQVGVQLVDILDMFRYSRADVEEMVEGEQEMEVDDDESVQQTEEPEAEGKNIFWFIKFILFILWKKQLKKLQKLMLRSKRK